MRLIPFLLAFMAFGCRGHLVATGLMQPSPESLDRHRDFRWVIDTTQHFVVRAETASVPIARLDSIESHLEVALRHVLETLELADEPERIHAFAVGSSRRVRALLGREVDGRAFFGTRVFAFAVSADWHATARHELTHVVLRNRWPGEPDQWLSEGVATYVGDHFHGRDVHQLVRERLVATGRVLPLRVLVRDFSRHPDEISYLQGASVAKYLRERFGVAALRAVWRGGLEALPRATGEDLDTFERHWRTVVEKGAPTPGAASEPCVDDDTSCVYFATSRGPYALEHFRSTAHTGHSW